EIDFSGATVSLANFREGPALPSDAVFYLVATDGADDIAALPENQSAYARQGLTRGYNFIVDDMADGQTPDKQYLVARLVYTGPAPEARIINEGRIAGLAFVSNSAGWLADHSYESADLNIREKEGGWEYASFGGADAGWQRIETGAHLDLTSSHLMLGRTAKRVREDGSLLYGGFIDAGFGHYGVRGDFGGAGQVSGRGNLRTVGLGFMTRRVRADGLRLEASLRGGQLRNRFRSYELTDTDGNITRYDLRVPYFGGHLGIGKEKKLSGKDRLDILLRYYYARQNGKTITLHTDERVDFAADESHRLRLGTRFTRQKNEYRYWYVGAALEYEFDGKARGIADGQYRLGEPDMGGLTGVLEVGGVAKPKPDSRFSAEYGVQFYAGKRSGLSGGIRLAWRF
ncbi:MAG: autotransporter outer membrane beta-barrel domain-containing protein, partial [Acidaminococcales bacterium]|nr:autotransporter outer membrane beta-barrel domain-containing protein [Acidaminococcales bacterium]